MASLYLAWGAILLIGKYVFVAGTPLSNCSGSPPSSCPYITYWNIDDCPEASLANATECRAAAQTLGYTVQGVHEVFESSKRPSGCSIDIGELKRDQVYFNKHPVGFIDQSHFQSICRNRVEVTDSFGIGKDFPARSSTGESRPAHEAYIDIVEDVTDESKCCSECWKANVARNGGNRTQLYEYQAGNIRLQYLEASVTNVCICLSKEPHEELINGLNNPGIHSTGICAKEYTICTAGDNRAGREIFIQENEYPGHSNCRDVCQRLYPASVGMTESTVEKYSHGKRKCWCEFGVVQESQVVLDESYRTCLFDMQF